MLKLIVGPYSALEGHLARRLAELKATRSQLPDPVALVVPSRTLIRHLEHALAIKYGLALANVRFHTFQSLARAIVLETGIPAAALAEDPLLEEFMLKAAIGAGAVREELAQLVKVPGLLSGLLNTLRDLGEARVDPENMPPESLEEEEGEIQQLLEVMPLLGHLSQNFKERGFVSRTGVVEEAAGRVSEAGSVAKLSALIYYGAYDMTQHQLDLLFALAEHAPVEVLFPAYAPRAGRLHPAYQFGEATLTLIGQKASETKWLESEGVGPLARHLPAIMNGEDGNFAGAGLPAGVSIWRARDTQAQWNLVAEECWRLIEKEGVAPHEITIVARSLEGALPQAAAAFAASRLPWTTRAPMFLPSLATGRALCALVKVLGGDFSPDVVLDAAASPALTICPEGLSLLHARAESRRLWAGARAKDWQCLAGRGGTAAVLLKAVSRLSEQAARFPKREGFAAYAQRLHEICERFMTDREVGWEESAPIFEAFAATLKRLGALGPSIGEVDADEFFQTAVNALERTVVSLFNVSGGVALLDAMDARGVSARAVFIVELTEGVFPRLQREDPFLRDPARRILNEVLGYKIQLKGQAGLEEERLLFHTLLDSARERLYLVWQAGEAGRPALPSSFLAELLDGFGAPVPEQALPVEESKPVVEQEAWPDYEAGCAWLAEMENTGNSPGAWDGIQFPAPGAGQPVRATQLVDMARCPFKAHLLAALNLEEPRGPRSAWEPEAAQIGLAVHDALDGAVKELRAKWATASDERQAEAARHHFTRALDKIIPEAGRFPPIRAQLLDDWGPLLAELLKADRDWTREKGLTPRGEEKQLAGRIGEEGFWLALSGRADRIDSGENLTHLVDYKSHLRRDRIPPSPRFSPDFYQLALYQGALGKPTGGWGLSVYHLGRGMGGVRFVHAEGGDADEILERTRRLNACLLALLEAGRMPPFPRERGKRARSWRPDCDLCQLSLLCRREHGPTMQRLQSGGAWADIEQVLSDGEENGEE